MLFLVLILFLLTHIFFPFKVNVHIPRDKLSQAHTGYGFVEFNSEPDADYAIKILNMIKLYGKPIRVNKACSICYTYCVSVLIVFLGISKQESSGCWCQPFHW